LFVEAVASAFAGIADVQAISADDVEAQGLVRAFRPDAIVAEAASAELAPLDTPCVRVDLELQELHLREGETWRLLDVELSPEAIRNAIVARLYGGEVG
jgi:hypothetical protein